MHEAACGREMVDGGERRIHGKKCMSDGIDREGKLTGGVRHRIQAVRCMPVKACASEMSSRGAGAGRRDIGGGGRYE